MGTIEMSVITTNTYESELGLVAAAQRVEIMSSAAVAMPKEWLQKMLDLAREQGATVPAVALSSFCDENITMFHVRAIAHAHPEVQKIVRGVVQEWSKLRKELNGAARGAITGNTAWVTTAEILQKALDEVGKVDQTLITIQVSIVEGAWRDMFAVPRTMQHPPIEFLKKQLHRVVAESALHLAAYTLILIPSGTWHMCWDTLLKPRAALMAISLYGIAQSYDAFIIIREFVKECRGRWAAGQRGGGRQRGCSF